MHIADEQVGYAIIDADARAEDRGALIGQNGGHDLDPSEIRYYQMTRNSATELGLEYHGTSGFGTVSATTTQSPSQLPNLDDLNNLSLGFPYNNGAASSGTGWEIRIDDIQVWDGTSYHGVTPDIDPTYQFTFGDGTDILPSVTTTTPEQPYIAAEDSWLYSYPNVPVTTTTTTSYLTNSDDFTSNNWLEQDDTMIGVDDTTNNRMDIELQRGSNDAATFDLYSALDSNYAADTWVLQWTQKWTTLQAGQSGLFAIGLSDDPSSDYSSISNLSSYFMMETTDSAKKRFGIGWSVDAQPFANNQRDTNKELTEGTEYYMELIRTSETTVTWTARTGSHTGTVVHTYDGSDSGIASVDDLRYIRVQNINEASPPSSGSFIGWIDDMKFYNGVIDTSDVVTSSTDQPSTNVIDASPLVPVFPPK